MAEYTTSCADGRRLTGFHYNYIKLIIIYYTSDYVHPKSISTRVVYDYVQFGVWYSEDNKHPQNRRWIFKKCHVIVSRFFITGSDSFIKLNK